MSILSAIWYQLDPKTDPASIYSDLKDATGANISLEEVTDLGSTVLMERCNRTACKQKHGIHISLHTTCPWSSFALTFGDGVRFMYRKHAHDDEQQATT